MLVPARCTDTLGWKLECRKSSGTAAATRSDPPETPRKTFSESVTRRLTILASPDAPSLRPPLDDGRRHLLIRRHRFPRHRRGGTPASVEGGVRALLDPGRGDIVLPVAVRPDGRGSGREVRLPLHRA